MQSRRMYTRRTTNRHAWRQRQRAWRYACWRHARAAVRHSLRWLARRRQPTPPIVIVLGRQPAARRLRRSVARAVRAYAGALGAPLPPHTTVLVMPAVIDDHRLHGLVELLEPPGGPRRAVISLATRPHGRPVSEDDLLAVLRQQVTRLVEAESDRRVVRLRVTLSAAAPAAPAAIVPLRPRSGGHRNGVTPQGRHDIGGPTSIDQWPDDDPA